MVEEPGRRIIAEEIAAEPNALPWRDLAAFRRRAIGNAIADHARRPLAKAGCSSTAGLVDAAAVASCHQIDSQ